MVALPQSAPKLSGFTEFLAQPEKQFSSMVKTSMGFSLPKGPNEMLGDIQKSLEKPGTKLEGFPTLPKLDLPNLPPLPELSSMLPSFGKGNGKEMYNKKQGNVDPTTGQPPRGVPFALPTRVTEKTPTLVKNGTPAYALKPAVAIPTLTK